MFVLAARILRKAADMKINEVEGDIEGLVANICKALKCDIILSGDLQRERTVMKRGAYTFKLKMIIKEADVYYLVKRRKDDQKKFAEHCEVLKELDIGSLTKANIFDLLAKKARKLTEPAYKAPVKGVTSEANELIRSLLSIIDKESFRKM